MRSIPLELTTELSKEAFRICHLIELSLSEVYRYTDLDMDIFYGGNQFFSRGIEFDEAQYSLLPKVDSISFQIDNVQLEISGIVMNQEVRGKQCVIYRAAIDQYLQVLGLPIPLFVGYLDRAEADGQRGHFEVYNQFIKWNTPTPRRKHTAPCPWVFKDTTTCRYAGSETWCDRSWNRCGTLNNTPNFGGNRWLPSLQGKEIWWGRVPK